MPSRRVLAELPRRSAVRRVALGGLDADGVAELVTRLVGHGLDAPLEQLAQHLSELTAGNPFLIGEQWRQLLGDGRVRCEGRHWHVDGPPAEAASPASVRDLITRQVARLGPDAKVVLPFAAVAGASFDVALVARAAALDIARTLAVLEDTAAAGLVQPAGTQEFRFRHVLVCQALSDALGPSARRGAHLALAEATLSLAPDRLGSLAYHYARAVPLAPLTVAIRWALRAAARALSTRSHDDTPATLEDVLAVTEQPTQRADLLLALSAVTALAGDLTRSLDATRQVAAIARNGNDPVRLVRSALVLEEVLCQGAERAPGFTDLVDDALAVVADDATRARLLGIRSACLALGGRDAEAVEVGDRAVALARTAGDDAGLAVVMHAVALRRVDVARLARSAGGAGGGRRGAGPTGGRHGNPAPAAVEAGLRPVHHGRR